MIPIRMTDGYRGQKQTKPNPKYKPRRMEKFTDKEIKNAIEIYKRALKQCEAELRSRRLNRNRE